MSIEYKIEHLGKKRVFPIQIVKYSVFIYMHIHFQYIYGITQWCQLKYTYTMIYNYFRIQVQHYKVLVVRYLLNSIHLVSN